MTGFLAFATLILVVVFLVATLFLQNASSAITKTPVVSGPMSINPEINEVATGLYLTNFKNAKDYDALKRLGVRQILTIGMELPRHGEPLFKVMHVRVDDSPNENIKKYFNSTYNFINRGPTVVHCAAGISRSATIVAAYLMRRFKMTSNQAIAHIKKCRSVVNPNYGFVQQLMRLEKELATNPEFYKSGESSELHDSDEDHESDGPKTLDNNDSFGDTSKSATSKNPQ